MYLKFGLPHCLTTFIGLHTITILHHNNKLTSGDVPLEVLTNAFPLHFVFLLSSTVFLLILYATKL